MINIDAPKNAAEWQGAELFAQMKVRKMIVSLLIKLPSAQMSGLLH